MRTMLFMLNFILFSTVGFSMTDKQSHDNPKIVKLFDEGLEENLKNFQENFPDDYKNLNFDLLQSVSLQSGNTMIVIPVLNEKKVMGRFVSLSNGESAYVDLKNYKESVVFYDVKEPNISEQINVIYDTKEDIYVLAEKPIVFWCQAACVASGLAIAAGDGPSPVLDVLAFAYVTACVADCAS